MSRNFDDFNFIPSRPFNCVVPIITDVADVNPTVTGIDMKSTRTPGKKENRQLVLLGNNRGFATDPKTIRHVNSQIWDNCYLVII